MRIAWYSPLFFRGWCRSALFTEECLRAARDWDVELFVDDADWTEVLKTFSHPDPMSGVSWGRFRIFHHLNAFERDSANPFDLFVYQIENSVRTTFVRHVFPIFPGVTIFHDLSLSKLPTEVRYRELSEEPEEVADDERSLRLLDFRRRGWGSKLFDEETPDVFRLAGETTVCAAKNVHALNDLRSQCPDAALELIHTPIEPLSDVGVEQARRGFRQSRGMSPDDFVIACSAESLVEDRAKLILDTFRSFSVSQRRASPRLLWIASGERGVQRAEQLLARLPADLSSRTQVELAPDRHELERALAASDVFVALRFETRHDIGLPTLIALACGTPVVASEFGPISELPPGVVITLPPGKGEREGFAEALDSLASNTALRNQLRCASKEYLQNVSSPASVIATIEAIARRHRPLLTEALARTRLQLAGAEKGILEGCEELFGPLGFRSLGTSDIREER
ncbi:MAG: glycosyltransferase [Deltaproteobacteria bacterium]|nr:glycosyltransferase [Deltaproteobacteria bacterium]